MAENHTIQGINKIGYKNIDPQHPIGNVLLKKISEKDRHAAEITLTWADRLLSKKGDGQKYLNAGSDWLGRAIGNAHLDRRPELLIIQAFNVARAHFKGDYLITILEQAIKKDPNNIKIKNALIDESYKLAKTQQQAGQNEDAINTLKRLEDKFPETSSYKGIKKIIKVATPHPEQHTPC